MANKKMLLFSLLQSKQANYRIFGMSRKANQLVQEDTFYGGAELTCTYDSTNDTYTLKTSDTNWQIANQRGGLKQITFVSGHKYLFKIDVLSKSANANFRQRFPVILSQTDIQTVSDNLSLFGYQIQSTDGNEATVVFKVNLHDLTQDQIDTYSLDQALEYYPKPYMAYTGQKGTIINAGGECVAEDENGNQKHFTLPLLRGIGDLKDTYETATGNTQRKFSEVDLGTMTFNYVESYKGFNFLTNPPVKVKDNYEVVSAISSIYSPISKNEFTGDLTIDMVMRVDNDQPTPYMYLRNLQYDNSATFKTAMSGVKLVYELATYTTEQNPSFGLGKGITRITDQNGYELEFEEIEIV